MQLRLPSTVSVHTYFAALLTVIHDLREMAPDGNGQGQHQDAESDMHQHPGAIDSDGHGARRKGKILGFFRTGSRGIERNEDHERNAEKEHPDGEVQERAPGDDAE